MNYTQSEEYLFNTMPVGRAIASLAVPTVISQIITVIYNMADTFFVGQLGDPNQVAAATVALPLFIFITALANLFGVGGASLISRCLGQGDRQKAGHTAAFCIWSAIAVSLMSIWASRPCISSFSVTAPFELSWECGKRNGRSCSAVSRSVSSSPIIPQLPRAPWPWGLPAA